MENIIDLILNEFDIANYHLLKNKQGEFLLANEANSDFWMILTDYDVAVDKQQELFEHYRLEMKEYPAAEKNISVLILKCIPQFNDDIKAWAVETENDKYYFKKYVLLYTQEDWKFLNNEILVEPKKRISDYLIDSSVFGNLKNEISDGPYTLLYGIAHKLPFLLLEMEKSKIELSYPTNWAAYENKETNEWVDGIPDDDNEISNYLDGLLNSINHEQD